MEKTGWTELHVKRSEAVRVTPCQPTPKVILHLSSIDNLFKKRIFHSLLVYNGFDNISHANPAKVIQEALSKVLVYYFPLAGRLRNKENGEVDVDCTGEGALFVEAMADNNLSVLGDLDDLKPSFQQLFFSLPLDTAIEDLHLLVVQVTHFTCGGFVLGVSFHHSICDGIGAGQFLKGLAEMVRGEDTLSLEPIWKRELLKPEDPIHLQFYHLESIGECVCNTYPYPTIKELVQASFIMNSRIIEYMKQYIMEECKQCFSTFEVVAALAWRARIKVIKIPLTQNVKLLFATNMRRSFIPPIPKGYYGNAIGLACAMDNAKDILNGSLLHVITIIRKSKVSLNNENFRSSIVTNTSPLDVHTKPADILLLSDWRHLGFNEVDFGWGVPMNVSPMEQMENEGIENVLPTQNIFTFLQSAKNQLNGIKILMCMRPSNVKSFKIEMEAMINEYVH